MSRYYDKDELKKSLSLDNIYDLVTELGGEPEYTDFGLISATICHNPIGVGSRKLYYYQNSKLFHCFSGCIEPSFDVFELVIKCKKNQYNEDWELYNAMDYVARYFNLSGIEIAEKTNELIDWQLFQKYDYQLQESKPFQLKEYDSSILDKFLYPRILSWEKEGITYEACKNNKIGYYPGKEQITIPHFDINNRLIGIRGRFLAEEDAEKFGKYRPLIVNGQMYNHPLSMNLYNLNNSKDNLRKAKVAIIFESEKSCLQMQGMYGMDNDISIACCGSSISSYQIGLLQELKINELILALDRQFQQIGDEEFKILKNKIITLHRKYNIDMKISAIFDKEMITPYKSSPTDQGKDIFEYLLKNRITAGQLG